MSARAMPCFGRDRLSKRQGSGEPPPVPGREVVLMQPMATVFDLPGAPRGGAKTASTGSMQVSSDCTIVQEEPT